MVYVAHHKKIRRPSLFLTMTDANGALVNRVTLPMVAPFLSSSPKGDGHPVLVLPPLGGDDGTTKSLRNFLQKSGYHSHSWQLGKNLFRKTIGENGEKLFARLEQIYESSGTQVSIVGWSLGGSIAREVARRRPELVRQVITLGSGINGSTSVLNNFKQYIRIVGGPVDEEAAKDIRFPPPGIPCTSIFTKTDGIIAWENCLELPGEKSDNIEVVSSHTGLGWSAPAYYAILDRLIQTKENWKPFSRTGLRKLFFPSSGHNY